ncbi:hypothetical protein ACROYT_G007647 [Oculina patagonica]
MLGKALLRFGEENFSDKYFASLHGETTRITPLALAVKKPRPFYARPFAKSELIILERLEKYVKSTEQKAFCEALNAMITKEELVMQGKLSLGASSKELGVEVSQQMEVTVRTHEDLGDVQLGKLCQSYITDPDIRGVLAEKAVLDDKKMEPHKDDDLYLITSVVYSDKLEVTGDRVDENELAAALTPSPISAKYVIPQVEAHFKKTNIPPGVAARNTRGPLLFKCCHATYNKETRQLEIPKGEYIGKTVNKTHRATDPAPKEEECNYSEDTFVNSNLDEIDSAVFTTGDLEKLETIEKEVLLAEKNREQCKARISKYLHWFERALSTDQDKLTIDEPLTPEDCRFLRQAYFSCDEDSNMLDLTDLTKDDIQGYGIVFKRLDDLSNEKWSELEMDLYGPE